ncbi:MAG: hypothetical protein ACREA8_10255, partial [Nitrosotalea sp.]
SCIGRPSMTGLITTESGYLASLTASSPTASILPFLFSQTECCLYAQRDGNLILVVSETHLTKPVPISRPIAVIVPKYLQII